MALALTMLLSLFLCQSTCGFKPCCQMIPPSPCVGLCNTAEECIPVIRFLHCYFQNKRPEHQLTTFPRERCNVPRALREALQSQHWCEDNPSGHHRSPAPGVPAAPGLYLHLSRGNPQATLRLSSASEARQEKEQTGYIQVLFKDQYYFFSKILLFVTQVRRQTPDYATLWLSFP